MGALWVESLGFPQPVADAIRRVAQPPGGTDGAARPRAAQRLRAGGRRGAEGRRGGRRRRPAAVPCARDQRRRRPARRRLRQALRRAAGDRAVVLSAFRAASPRFSRPGFPPVRADSVGPFPGRIPGSPGPVHHPLIARRLPCAYGETWVTKWVDSGPTLKSHSVLKAGGR